MWFETLPWTEAVDFVGWSLLHSLWQGTVLALAVAAALALLRRRTAAIRYLVACAGLLLMLVLPGITAWQAATGAEAAPPKATAAAADRLQRSASGPTDLTIAENGTAPAGRADALLSVAAQAVDPVLPWLVFTWLLGVVALSMRLAGGWIDVRRLRCRAVTPVPARWQRRFDDLARRLSVGRPVRLRASARLLIPVACGWLRPMVLVPVSMLTSLPPAQVETILAHELAHVRRNDYLFNLLQSVLEILLFYHPAAWYVSGRIREERENCCDDLAVAACGDPRLVARALAGLEELRAGAPGSPALAATGGSLLARVRRLLTPPAPAAGEAGPRMAAVAFLATALLLAFLPTALDALPTAPAGLAASDPSRHLVSTAFSFEDEMRVERTCMDWEKVRRCVDGDGHGRFECAPRSPLAAVLAPFRERQRDDAEVRVEVVRQAPEVGGSGSTAALPATPEGAAGMVEVRRVVGELPTCRQGR